MVRAAGVAEHGELRLGEGDFPPELDRVNFGAFLLGVLWAPWHRLWGWFGAFVALEILESVIGLTMLRFLGGALVQLVAMVTFRIVYWTVTVAFALRANRLVWTEERKRAARPRGPAVPRRPARVAEYLAAQRIWTVAGLIILAGTPLLLLVGSISGSSGVVVATVGTQTILLAPLFAYDKMRVARRSAQR
jgi:hypothetical protein